MAVASAVRLRIDAKLCRPWLTSIVNPRTTVLCQGKSNFGKLYAVHAVRHSEAVLTVMVAICSHGVHFLEKVQVQVRSLEHNRTVTEIVVFEPRTSRRVRSVGVSESLGARR